MKPLKLKMNDFGTFSGENIIDFSLLGCSDIFLITGDTGAGKSTIFDALVFALFGEASGSRRQPEDFITHFKEKPDTKVELEFLHHNEIYKVERTLKPQKNRASTKTAVLTYPDGEIVNKPTMVTEAIASLLGINKDQFAQIVVLAQGEFMKFITSKPEDKSKILRTVFGTQRFEILKNKLSDLNKEAKNKCSETDIKIKANMEGLIYDSEKWDIDIYNIDKYDEAIEAFLKIEKENDEIYSGYLKKHSELSEKQKTVFDICAKLEAYEEKINYLKRLTDEIENIKEKKETAKKENENAKKEREQLDISNVEMKRIADEAAYKKSVMPKYDEAERLRSELKACEEKFAEEKNKEDCMQKEIESLALKSKEYKDSIIISRDEDFSVKLSEKNALLEKLKEEKENIQSLIKETEKLAFVKEDMQKKERELLNANAEYEKSKNIYDDKRNKFFLSQAALIAEEIRDKNIPCPVCGSTEFVCLAEYGEDTVTKAQLDSAEKERNKKDGEAKKRLVAYTEKNAEYEALFDKLKEDFEKSCGNLILDSAADVLTKYAEEKTAETKKTEAEIKSISEIIKKNKFYEEEIGRIAEKAADMAVEREELNKLIKKTEVSVGEKKGAMQAIVSQLPYSSREECQREIKRLEKIYNEFESKKESVREKIEKTANYLTSLETRLNENIKFKNDETEKAQQLKEILLREAKENLFVDGISKEAVEGFREDINNQIKSINEKMQRLGSVIDNNKNKIKLIKSELKEREKRYSYYTKVRSLYETAAGNVNKTGRIDFEQYILSYYFSRVIEEADKRLSVMTEGRYMLIQKYDKISGDISSLKIDIYDEYTGREREITSISGGEMFKCALAMALGLSDVIQENAGGVEIDAIFIDEGFGSLDAVSRQQALRAVREIAAGSKMVGIISHVTELKEEITSKIIVEKGINGSSVKVCP